MSENAGIEVWRGGDLVGGLYGVADVPLDCSFCPVLCVHLLPLRLCGVMG